MSADGGDVSHRELMQVVMRLHKMSVPYHCGGWPEEVNTCFLNSYMVYL